MKHFSVQILLFTFLSGCTTFPSQQAHAEPPFLPCPQDSSRLKLRSEELQIIVKEDQQDRTPPIDWQKVAPRDEARRKRIGEIFGEGCFKEAQDYAAAALVYQHGVLPDHFFQTFLWAKKAVELGDPAQKWLMAAGIDRYLVNIEHKQLFATQASKPNMNDCWCLEEVEKTFPERTRVEYGKKTLKEALDWVDSLNESDPKCKPAKFCNKGFKSSPAGTVPGFW